MYEVYNINSKKKNAYLYNMPDLCLDLRMSLKSEMTAITYADTNINNLLHNKIREWYNHIMLSIYTNPEIQGNMNAFFQYKQILPWGNESAAENLKKFIHDTFSMTDLNDQQKKKREQKIIDTFNVAVNNNAYLFKYSTIFDLFFILYLKGGMATRYICMLLNTLSDGTMFSAELLQEQLGSVSDYDFNCIINATFERPVYELFYNLLKRILTNECEKIAKTDPFFNDESIRARFFQNAQTVAVKFPVILSGGCNIITNQPLGFSSDMEIAAKFGLVRLMANVPIKCAGSICFKDETGSGKNTASIITELIDVSLPLFDNLEERHQAWIYSNKAVAIKWCFIDQNKCDPILEPNDVNMLRGKVFKIKRSSGVIEPGWSLKEGTSVNHGSVEVVKGDIMRSFDIQQLMELNPELFIATAKEKYSLTNKIRVYSLQSAIDDLTVTIRESEERGDTAKIEKRKRRLNFFKNLICQYTLLVNNQDGNINKEELSKYCVQNVEGLLCTNEFMDEDISLVLAQFSLGFKQDENLVFSIIYKYITFIITNSLSSYNYKTSLLTTFKSDYQKFISSLNANQLNQIKPFLCNLLINTISLNKSLNDNFIIAYIGFLFIQTISLLWTDVSSFIQTTPRFNPRLIMAMEQINNFSTRNIIKTYAKPIIENIFNLIQGIYRDEAVQVLIRGGCAVHMNINSSFDKMNTNDIDLVINLQRYDNQFIVGLQQMFEIILAELRQSAPTADMKFEYVLYGQLFQVIIDYDIRTIPGQITELINTSLGQINLHSIIPRVRHHIVEINFVNSPSKIYSDDQVIQLSNNGKHECVFYNSAFLIKEYNKLLMESKHWYRKSKYLRRIAAINGVITDMNVRISYESEFPLP